MVFLEDHRQPLVRGIGYMQIGEHHGLLSIFVDVAGAIKDFVPGDGVRQTVLGEDPALDEIAVAEKDEPTFPQVLVDLVLPMLEVRVLIGRSD